MSFEAVQVEPMDVAMRFPDYSRLQPPSLLPWVIQAKQLSRVQVDDL